MIPECSKGTISSLQANVQQKREDCCVYVEIVLYICVCVRVYVHVYEITYIYLSIYKRV